MRVVRLYFTCPACGLTDICLGFHVRNEAEETVEQWRADAEATLNKLHHQLRPDCQGPIKIRLPLPEHALIGIETDKQRQA